MLERIIQFDINLMIYLNNLGTSFWDGFWMFMTSPKSAIPVYAVVLFFLFKKLGVKKTLISLLFLGVLIALSDQTSNLFKYGFERLRPCHEPRVQDLIRLVKPNCGGYYSFFSAHASTSSVIAVFCSLLLRKDLKYIPYILIPFALLVGYSRVYIGVHYPLDVLFGFLVGLIYAFLIYKLLMIVCRKLNIK